MQSGQGRNKRWRELAEELNQCTTQTRYRKVLAALGLLKPTTAAALILAAASGALYTLYWIAAAGSVVLMAWTHSGQSADAAAPLSKPYVAVPVVPIGTSVAKQAVSQSGGSTTTSTPGKPGSESGPSVQSQQSCEQQIATMEEAMAAIDQRERKETDTLNPRMVSRLVVLPKIPVSTPGSPLQAILKVASPNQPILINGVAIAQVEELFANFLRLELVAEVPQSIADSYVALLETTRYFHSVESVGQTSAAADVDLSKSYSVGARPDDLWHLAGPGSRATPFEDDMYKIGGANVMEAWKLLPLAPKPITVAVVEVRGVASEFKGGKWSPNLLPGYNLVVDGEQLTEDHANGFKRRHEGNNQPATVRAVMREARFGKPFKPRSKLFSCFCGQRKAASSPISAVDESVDLPNPSVFDGTGPDGRDWDTQQASKTEKDFFTGTWASFFGSHGTAVSNLIAAYHFPGTLTPGVVHNAVPSSQSSPPYTSVSIAPIRVGNSDDTLSLGIAWAAGIEVPDTLKNPNPARVINLSVGGAGSCPAVMQASIDLATSRGAIVVVAAGNDGDHSLGKLPRFPANCKNVITVSGHTPGPHPRFAPNSNVTDSTTISAPYGGLTCRNEKVEQVRISALGPAQNKPRGAWELNQVAGTSFSTPIVSGVVAMMLQVNPALDVEDVRRILRETGREFSQHALAQSMKEPKRLTHEILYTRVRMVDGGAAVRRAATYDR